MRGTSWITVIGVAAAIITTSSWLPQVVQTIRTRSTKDFSWGYLAMFASGTSLWLLYGMLLRDAAIIGANGVTVALVVVIAIVKAAGDGST